MKKVCFLTSLLPLMVSVVYGQVPMLQSQYFQNAPAFNPALAGLETYWDIKAGYRQQWSGLEDAPESMFFSAYGLLNHLEHHFYDPKAYSLRISDPSQYGETEHTLETERKAKKGIGGFVLQDAQGIFKQVSGQLNYAHHFPIGNSDAYLSLGATLGLTNYQIDFVRVRLRDMDNDRVYNSLLNNGSSNTFLNGSWGLCYYTSEYYFSYGMASVFSTVISGNKEVLQENSPQHQVMMGYRLNLNHHFALLPSGILRMGSGWPEEWMMNVKLRYADRFWVGAGYRNGGDIVGMFGLNFDHFLSVSYSYDLTTSNISDFNNGSHEVIIGLQLYNYTDTKTYFW